MEVLDRGARVLHSDYGEGVIVAKAGYGNRRVCFDRTPTLPRTVNGRELVVIPGGQAPAPDVPRERVQSPRLAAATLFGADPLARCDAWQTLEALRLGVVPSRGVEDYTVARAAELASMRQLLSAGQGCRVVWGDYGTGKTHLLDAAEQLALEHGFATARITLDPSENALHHPLRLYQRITESVRTADLVGAGFEAIFERLLDSQAHHDPNGDHASRFFSPYLHVMRHGNEEQIGWLGDYVRGDDIDAAEVNSILARLRWKGRRVLRLSNFRTFGRMYIHLVSTLACWCADAGTQGLVLLFDEVERVDALRAEDRHYAFEVLRHYAAVTIEEEDLAFDPEQLYKGGQSVHRDLPLCFRAGHPLATIFALTPLQEIEARFSGVTASPAYDLRLDRLDQQCLGELVRRVAAIYHRAHAGHVVTEATLGSICTRLRSEFDDGHDSFRAVVSATVFLLDADRLGTAGH